MPSSVLCPSICRNPKYPGAYSNAFSRFRISGLSMLSCLTSCLLDGRNVESRNILAPFLLERLFTISRFGTSRCEVARSSDLRDPRYAETPKISLLLFFQMLFGVSRFGTSCFPMSRVLDPSSFRSPKCRFAEMALTTISPKAIPPVHVTASHMTAVLFRGFTMQSARPSCPLDSPQDGTFRCTFSWIRRLSVLCAKSKGCNSFAFSALSSSFLNWIFTSDLFAG
jgi:hypothetical protein